MTQDATDGTRYDRRTFLEHSPVAEVRLDECYVIPFVQQTGNQLLTHAYVMHVGGRCDVVSPAAPAAVMVIDGLLWRVTHWQPVPPATGVYNEKYCLKDVEGVVNPQFLTERRKYFSQQSPLVFAQIFSKQ